MAKDSGAKDEVGPRFEDERRSCFRSRSFSKEDRKRESPKGRIRKTESDFVFERRISHHQPDILVNLEIFPVIYYV